MHMQMQQPSTCIGPMRLAMSKHKLVGVVLIRDKDRICYLYIIFFSACSLL